MVKDGMAMGDTRASEEWGEVVGERLGQTGVDQGWAWRSCVASASSGT